MGGKVAEIEFFEVGNHVENGHLSADKVTQTMHKESPNHCSTIG